MVTRLTNYTKQFWILLSTDDLDALGSHNGDEAIVIDRNERYVFDEENQTWRQIHMSGGGEAVLVTKTVTANGTYNAADDNADGFSTVTVDVQGYTIDEIAQKTIAGDITISATSLPKNAMVGFTGITRVSCPNVTSVGDYAFGDMSGLRGIYADDFPSLVNMSPEMFNGSGGAFAVFKNPVILAIYCLSRTAFTVVDLTTTSQSPTVYGKMDRTFSNSTNMNTLILRHNYVNNLTNTNAFNGTPFASNGSGGTLYVPSALVSAYQSATNWTTILGYPNNQIKAIEGSIYETQYADGTPIS